MPAPTFDTLAYADKRKQAGFSEEQAQGQARALAEIVYGEVATRPDLNVLETSLRKDLNALGDFSKRLSPSPAGGRGLGRGWKNG